MGKDDFYKELGLKPPDQEAEAETAEDSEANNPGSDQPGEDSKVASATKLNALEKRVDVIETRINLGLDFTEDELQKGLKEHLEPLRQQLADLQEQVGRAAKEAEAKTQAEVEEQKERDATSLCPGCEKDVGWQDLKILRDSPFTKYYRECPECGHQEQPSKEDVDAIPSYKRTALRLKL